MTMVVHGTRTSTAGAALRLAIVVAAVSACGSLVKMEPPAADGPRISGLEVATARPLVGCPVRFKLHVDAGEGRLAGIGWVRLDRRAWGSGREIVALEPAPSGDAVVALAPGRGGLYACQVQVADRSGRWSNVLQTRIAVDSNPAGETPRCA
jgi:hypothetical protein